MSTSYIQSTDRPPMSPAELAAANRRGPELREVAEDPRIAARTARDLLTGMIDLGVAATQADLNRGERLARFSAAAEAARDVPAALGTLNPYHRDPSRALIADLMHAAGVRGWAAASDKDAAARIALAGQHAELAHQLRATSNLGPLSTLGGRLTPPAAATDVAVFLAEFATPATVQTGPPSQAPGAWENLPDAAIGDAEQAAELITIPASAELPFIRASWGSNRAMQAVDWTVSGARSLELLTAMIVDTTLERAVLTSLAAGVLASASFEAAERSVGDAWPTGADLVIVHGYDLPRVRRMYADENLDAEDRPRIMATAGGIKGTALVVATPALFVEATRLLWAVVTEPAHLGSYAHAWRYARASKLVANTVATVTIPAA